jgi:hypothetical protein
VERAERLRGIVGSGTQMLALTAPFNAAEHLERIAADLAPKLES